MKCKNVQKLLPAYLEDTLTEGKTTLVDEHIQNCDACRRELRAFEKTIRLASNIQVEYPQPELWENFMPILHSRIAQQNSKERRISIGWLSPLRLASYGVVTLILIGFLALGTSIMFSNNPSEASPIDIETLIASQLIDDTLAKQAEKAHISVVNESPMVYEILDIEDDITSEYDIPVAEGGKRIMRFKQVMDTLALETIYPNGFVDVDLKEALAYFDEHSNQHF